MNPANWPPVHGSCMCLPTLKDVQCPTHGRFGPGDVIDARIPVWGVDTVGVIEPKPITTPLPEVKWRERFDTPTELDLNPLIDEALRASGTSEFYRAVESMRPNGDVRWVPDGKDLLAARGEIEHLKGKVKRLEAQAARHRDDGEKLRRLRDRVWNLAQDLKRAVNGVGVD